MCVFYHTAPATVIITQVPPDLHISTSPASPEGDFFTCGKSAPTEPTLTYCRKTDRAKFPASMGRPWPSLAKVRFHSQNVLVAEDDTGQSTGPGVPGARGRLIRLHSLVLCTGPVIMARMSE